VDGGHDGDDEEGPDHLEEDHLLLHEQEPEGLSVSDEGDETHPMEGVRQGIGEEAREGRPVIDGDGGTEDHDPDSQEGCQVVTASLGMKDALKSGELQNFIEVRVLEFHVYTSSERKQDQGGKAHPDATSRNVNLLS